MSSGEEQTMPADLAFIVLSNIGQVLHNSLSEGERFSACSAAACKALLLIATRQSIFRGE